jgi:hypothetical protein
MTAPTDLARDIASAINRVSRENVSNTPDFILAEMLVDILTAFEKASNARETWYGRGVRTIVSEDSNREGGEANIPGQPRPDKSPAAPDPDPGSPSVWNPAAGFWEATPPQAPGDGEDGIASRDVLGDLERERDTWRLRAETAERERDEWRLRAHRNHQEVDDLAAELTDLRASAGTATDVI